MANALNVIAWAGTYGLGLNGASDVVTSTAKTGYQIVNYFWKGVGEGTWETDNLKTKCKENISQFYEGGKFVALALVIRQFVARIFTPVAPDCVTNALSLLGWQHVRSPLVDGVYNLLPNFITSRVTLY